MFSFSGSSLAKCFSKIQGSTPKYFVRFWIITDTLTYSGKDWVSMAHNYSKKYVNGCLFIVRPWLFLLKVHFTTCRNYVLEQLFKKNTHHGVVENLDIKNLFELESSHGRASRSQLKPAEASRAMAEACRAMAEACRSLPKPTSRAQQDTNGIFWNTFVGKKGFRS